MVTTMLRLVADVVVTMDEAGRIFAPGAVDVADGRIVRVGPPDAPGPETVERVGGVLLPGLVDAHCHSPMTLLRGAGEGLPLGRWLTEVMWPREARMTGEDVYWGMTLAAAELLTAGITTSCEMYLWSADLARAAVDAGLRSVVCAPIVVAPGWERFGTWREQADAAVELAEAFADEPLVEVGIGPHSAYAVPPEGLEYAAAVAADHDMLLHLHVAESRDEDAEIRERHGSVPRLLAELGVLDAPRILAAHCVWMDDVDLELWARHRVAVAHCPGSNAKLASGIARIADMLDRGIVVAVATDGPASNDDLGLWEEVRLAPMLARLRALDAETAPDARQALAMATREAARALGRDDLGVLAPGRRADLVRLDLADPTFAPIVEATDVVSHLVWSVGARAVTDVWVEGRRVVAGRRCLTVDVDRARREVDARARRLAEEAS
ncbi:MAG TPA: amidohydrolase [Actinobacteria bacterium]|nr:amidohydrolase [Actinomycetota bacterium]